MKTRTRFTLFGGLVAVGALALTACTPTNAPSTPAPGNGEVGPIGYSALFLQDPAQAAMVQAFQKDTADLGVKALSPTSANGDAAQQDSDVRNLVTAGAKSLFLIPADPSAIVSSIDFARKKGIKVVSLMLGPTGGKVDISMQVDNYAIGKAACDYLAAKVGESGTVLHVQGDMRQVTAQLRDSGFQDCIKKDHPGIKLIAKSGGQWDSATAAASVAGVLVSNPELGGIFMASDGYVDAVAQVLESNGKTAAAGQAGHVWTVSVDGTPSALDAIRKGKLDVSASQPITDFIKYGLGYLKTLADGGKIAEGATDHGSTIIMTDDGYLADSFPAILITADTVEDPTNWANTVG